MSKLQKNEIVVNFLGGLTGFVRLENNKILHLETNQIITPYYDMSALGEEQPEEATEEIKITTNMLEVFIDYRDIVNFYISSHAKNRAIIDGIDGHKEFLDMRKHLELKFCENGYDEEYF